MRAGKVFIDSNTFLYSFDAQNPEKIKIAKSWLAALAAQGAGVTNLQVLNEVANVAIRKTRQFGGPNPFSRIDGFAIFGTSPISFEITIAARSIHLKYRYSWWDSLLLAAALDLGCTHFLSEDLQDGQAIEGLTIVSPFAHTPEQVLVSR